MLDALGEVLPPAVGIALSPFVVIAIVLALSTPRASANGLAFATGWLAGLSAVTAIMLVVTEEAYDSYEDAATLAAWISIAVGLALVVLATKKWRGRPRPGADPEMPGWMASFDDIQPSRSLVLGAAIAGANPKNLAFTYSAASSIGALGLTTSGAAGAGAAYVLLASSSVLVSVGAHLALGARAEAALAAAKQFMLTNNTVIMMVILLILGAKLIGDGLAGL